MTARRLMQILSENDPETLVFMKPGKDTPFVDLKSVGRVTSDAFRGSVLVLNGFVVEQPKRDKTLP